MDRGKAGDIVFTNVPIIFDMGVAIGMAKKEKEVAGKEGDKVKKGDLLMKLDLEYLGSPVRSGHLRGIKNTVCGETEQV